MYKYYETSLLSVSLFLQDVSSSELKIIETFFTLQFALKEKDIVFFLFGIHSVQG